MTGAALERMARGEQNRQTDRADQPIQEALLGGKTVESDFNHINPLPLAQARGGAETGHRVHRADNAGLDRTRSLFSGFHGN